MNSLGCYYTYGGMGSVSYIYGFYPYGDKILMMYFTPDSNYCDFPLISGVLITKEKYQELMDTASGQELDDELTDTLFSVGDYEGIEELYAYDDLIAIADVILSNPYAKDTANAWYKNGKSFFSDSGRSSLSTKLEDAILNAADVGELRQEPWGFMDKLDAECKTYSELLRKVRKYLD